MRLLHTSDWHIGRSLHGTDLLAEQEAVLARLAEVVVAESVDAVLVAGDVYDRAVPSADATAVLDRALWDAVPDEGARSLDAVLVPCDDLGSPGDVDFADELPGRVEPGPAES